MVGRGRRISVDRSPSDSKSVADGPKRVVRIRAICPGKTRFSEKGVAALWQRTGPRPDRISSLWVQDWVQLKREEWLRFSCKRHQIGHLGFLTLSAVNRRVVKFESCPGS
jgi:hypothetical protein